LWSQPPWLGDADWQGVLSNVLDRWKTASEGRIPPGWEESRRERPDRQVMTEAGYQCLGAFDFPAEHRWTVEGLVGWFFSTSFLSRHTLGDRAAAFEADMHTSLARFGAALLQTIDFVYELYRVPVSGERSSTG
jgi:hypothetical protein